MFADGILHLDLARLHELANGYGCEHFTHRGYVEKGIPVETG